MNGKVRVTWFIAVLGWCANARALPHFVWFDADAVPSPLILANRAWLRGDSRQAARRIVEALQSHLGIAAQSNAIELMEACYPIRGFIPTVTHWRLLGALRDLEIHVRRNEKGNAVNYQVAIQGDTVRPGLISEISLKSSEGELLLSKEGRKGSWREFNFPRVDQKHGFYLTSEERDIPLPDGVYRLMIMLKDGRRSDDQIVIANGTSATVPQINYPLPEQEVSTANPIVQWTAFRSPQYRSYETQASEARVIRLRSAGLSIDERMGPWWGAFLNPAETSIRVGTRYQHGVGYGEPELREGRYLLRLSYSEGRRFGDTTLVRESVTDVPFSVRLAE